MKVDVTHLLTILCSYPLSRTLLTCYVKSLFKVASIRCYNINLLGMNRDPRDAAFLQENLEIIR